MRYRMGVQLTTLGPVPVQTSGTKFRRRALRKKGTNHIQFPLLWTSRRLSSKSHQRCAVQDADKPSFPSIPMVPTDQVPSMDDEPAVPMGAVQQDLDTDELVGASGDVVATTLGEEPRTLTSDFVETVYESAKNVEQSSTTVAPPRIMPVPSGDDDDLLTLDTFTPAVSDSSKSPPLHQQIENDIGSTENVQDRHIVTQTKQSDFNVDSNRQLPGTRRQSENDLGSVELDQISTPYVSIQSIIDAMFQFGAGWVLIVLGIAYLHNSATGFSIPAMLPLIGTDLDLSDSQMAFLTLEYTALYALALVPVGYLADRVDRPKLLAGGLAVWSALTSVASQAGSFRDLLLLRVGFAAAQATQNPICFNLIPEIFPNHKSTALAVYNSAVYIGRALSFAFVFLLGRLGISGEVGIKMIPLDKFDTSSMELLYTTGDMAAVMPVYDYNFQMLFSETSVSSWRDVLLWLGLPGLVIATVVLFTISDPRGKGKGSSVDPTGESTTTASVGSPEAQLVADGDRLSDFGLAVQQDGCGVGAGVASILREEEPHDYSGIIDVLKTPGFQVG